MKLRDYRLAGHAQGSIANREVIRARAVTAEFEVKHREGVGTHAYGSGTHAYGKEFDHDTQTNAGTNSSAQASQRN